MARTTASDVSKTLQEDLSMDHEPTGQEVARAMYNISSSSFRNTIGDPNEVSSLEFMSGLLEYPDTLGVEFMSLATRIGRVIAHRNILRNKLAPFKMANMPLGYTMEEYFVFPYRNKLYSFIDMFDRLVETTDMEIVEVNQEIAKKAAQIRAEYKNFKAMDAIQLAVACLTKCDLFLTNDKQLRQFKEIKCVTVDELE